MSDQKSSNKSGIKSAKKGETIIRHFYSDLLGAGEVKLAAIDHYVGKDFVAHELPLDQEDYEAYKRYLGLYATCFRDINQLDLRDLFSCDDKVVTRWSWNARHSGEFMGIPASGRRITIKGIDIFRLRDGKIIELWQEIDVVGILQQISAPVVEVNQ